MWNEAAGSSKTVGVVLNVAFALGLLANIVKAADLVLRPYQQKRIQQALEDFTLRLEYFDTTKLLNSLSNPDEIGKVTRSILYFQGVVLALEVSLVCFGVIFGKWPGETLFAALCAALVMIGMLRFGWVEVGMRWFVGSARLLSFSIRYTILLSAEVVPLVLWRTTLLSSKNVNYVLSENHLTLVFLLFPFLAVYSIALYVGACWIVVELGRLILIKGLTILRGTAWRIVEFNKGAVAAIVLIVTVFLGIAAQIMK
jgi:hypothetical protein